MEHNKFCYFISKSGLKGVIPLNLGTSQKDV